MGIIRKDIDKYLITINDSYSEELYAIQGETARSYIFTINDMENTSDIHLEMNLFVKDKKYNLKGRKLNNNDYLIKIKKEHLQEADKDAKYEVNIIETENKSISMKGGFIIYPNRNYKPVINTESHTKLNKEQRIQRELDRLGLKIGQKFKVLVEPTPFYINDCGLLQYEFGASNYNLSNHSILELEPEDITWREFTQPDWSEELLGWCKGWEDCWATNEYDFDYKESYIVLYLGTPIWGDKQWSSFYGVSHMQVFEDDFVKSHITEELQEHLQTGKDGTVIQIIDGKPYLRQVIDGVIQED